MRSASGSALERSGLSIQWCSVSAPSWRRIAAISHTSCCAASRPVVSVSRNTIFTGVLLFLGVLGPPQGRAFGGGGGWGWYRAAAFGQQRPVPVLSHGGRLR